MKVPVAASGRDGLTKFSRSGYVEIRNFLSGGSLRQRQLQSLLEHRGIDGHVDRLRKLSRPVDRYEEASHALPIAPVTAHAPHQTYRGTVDAF